MWVLVGMLVFCFGGCGVLALSAGGDSKAKSGKTTTQAVVSSAPAPAQPPDGQTAAPAPAPTSTKPKGAPAPAGSAVRDGQFEFTVLGIEQGETQVGNGLWDAKAKGEFIIVHISVSNIGKRAQTYFAANQLLFDDQDRRFESSFEAGIALESGSASEELNPGQQFTTFVVFDVPKGLVPVHMRFHDSMFSGGAKVALR
ncbi:DUF4352 domain-containing protein [Nocardia yamanashiensis]|uniref:DUF4352 domain-containing protein n=1 Tax=Nocardia yamanashiensis TaxID=209247 RepID=UPI001E397118|nr:DUF4352 domain-containing protein [Nocardia yamanashiensis]UGT44275.1 DUF4352 domain-containing protein [Nocardia yamanashiensis]